MEDQISSEKKLKDLQTEHDRTSDEVASYRKELKEKSAEMDLLMRAELKNYCNKLYKQVWEEFQKRTYRAVGLFALIATILGTAGFLTFSNMIEIQVQRISAQIDEKVDKKIDSAVGERRGHIEALTGELLKSILASQRSIEEQLALFKVNLQRIGRDALMYAIQGDDPRVVQMLLDAGADPNAKDVEDRTALFWATSRGKVKIVQALLNK